MDELNRDLLMAVLALLTDAVPREAMFDALGDWARDRRQPLAQVLVRNRAIDPEHLRALLCLSQSHLARHQDDLRSSLDAWNAQGLTEEILSGIEDVGLRTTLGAAVGLEATVAAEVDGDGGPEGDATIPADGGAAETLALVDGALPGAGGAAPTPGGERFQPIRPYAKGGIGQVWLARDDELQREVALKVIQDRFVDHPGQRARFLLEAEITGNLEHPGIVPVYSLGRDARGRPYYAMRFIRGESMGSAIRRFHLRRRGQGAESGRDGGMWGVEFRELLGRFLDVCDAIAYAHSRGVLHRDLKPANIMLGRYGETLVVDWGLAKVIGRPDIVPAMAPDEAEPSLSATATRASTGDTQPGTTIGTPSYMSPEQARGALDEMGPPSDVYSLGATLYELLTGQVAFAGDKTQEVISRVVRGDFRPPRAALRSIPAPLEAICLKAMAMERRDRYDTVRELALDIRHWLADEPVSAHAEGRLERLGRWQRRHRTGTSAVAAALVGITLAASVGMVVVERGRRREADARALAEKNYNMARRAVEDYFTRVSEDTLLKFQDSVDMRRLRYELLRTALGYYQEFLRERGGDPGLRRELAEAQLRVGQIIREIGKPAEALGAFRAAIAIWEQLRASDPADRQVRGQLARGELALGEQLAWIRDFPPAFSALNRSRDLLKGLEAERPSDVSYRSRLAECDRELGIAEGEAGELDPGLEHLREAEAILRRLLATAPADASYRKELADTINAQGFIHSARGQDEEALRAFRDFQSMCEALLAESGPGPRPAQLLNSLGTSYYNVGAILHRRDHREAVGPFERSLECRTALAEAHPSVDDFREKLALSLSALAPLRHEFGRSDQAFAEARKAVGLLEALVASQPDQPRLRAELGRALNILGYLHDEFRDNAQAERALERARVAEERAVHDDPESDQYKTYLVEILQNLGEQSADRGDVAPGLAHYRRAVEVRREMLAAHPGDRARTLNLADQLAMLATVQRHGGLAADAERTYAEAETILDRLAGDPDARLRRGALLTGRGMAAADRGEDARALGLLRRSVEHLRPTIATAGDDVRPRQRLTEALWGAALLARRSGSPAEADGYDAERRGLWTGAQTRTLAELAMEEWGEAARVGYGRIPAEGPAASVRRLDLDLAAENLRMAVALGFRDLAWLRAGRESSLLLSRPDVRPLVGELGFPEDPFGTVAPSR